MSHHRLGVQTIAHTPKGERVVDIYRVLGTTIHKGYLSHGNLSISRVGKGRFWILCFQSCNLLGNASIDSKQLD